MLAKVPLITPEGNHRNCACRQLMPIDGGDRQAYWLSTCDRFGWGLHTHTGEGLEAVVGKYVNTLGFAKTLISSICLGFAILNGPPYTVIGLEVINLFPEQQRPHILA